MVLDSLKSHRMIGIIQPRNNNNELFMMGCIGKITSFIETPDYRIVLNLEGVCRFVLQERDLTQKGYYQATINSSDYLEDLNSMEPQIDRSSLIHKYENFSYLSFTSLINYLYENEQPITKSIVRLSFTIFNRIPQLKQLFIKQAMGKLI